MRAHPNEDPQPIRLIWLPGIAVGALCALLVWPQTRQLVSGQLLLAIPTHQSMAAATPAGFTEPAVSDYVWPIIRKCANEHADFLPEQIAAATSLPPEPGERSTQPGVPMGQLDSSIKIARLQTLVPRFANQPSLYATILRYTTQGKVRLTQDEAARFLPDSHGASASQSAIVVHSSPHDVEMFDDECLAAERLDPDNGFFPAMHAIGLFESRKDAEALDALERAGACNHWIEYLDDEYEGDLKLQTEAFGPPGPLTRSTFAAAMLLPHLASIRASAKLALYEAMVAEQAGHLSDGLRIRTAVRRVGSLMRCESRNLIGSLVGISLVKMSLMRPAGLPAAASKADVFTQTEAREVLLRGFDAYLATAGSTRDSESVHAEIDACVRTRAIITASLHSSVFNTDLTTVLGLSVTDMIVLSTVVWLATLGGVVCLLTVTSGSKQMKRLPRAARIALLTTLALVAGASTVALLIHQANGSVGCIAKFGQLWFSSEDGTPPGHSPLQVLFDAYLGIIAVIPVMMILTLTALCMAWRVPVVAGVARGIRGCTLPLCSILVIAYAVLTTITASYGSRLDSRLTEAFAHEGRATARQIGAEWPGIVR